jgi:succinate dehydrogenase / fumarate reductase iron-sulfur subunit
MKIQLFIWRQRNKNEQGRFVKYDMDQVSPDMSFLEMLDVLNQRLETSGEMPVAFEHDCREGICGSCAMMINGHAHGPEKRTTACQLHMRSFKDGDTIYIEPWRAAGFPVVKDLVADRSSLDRIIEAGGYISINTGSAPEANSLPVSKADAEEAMDAAACIGCGACVAACPNGSAMLFTAAKVAHLSKFPQGQPERYSRVRAMVKKMEEEIFGSCTNFGECQEACPKGISLSFITQLNRDYIKACLSKAASRQGTIKAQ